MAEKVKEAAEDAVETVKNWVSPEPTLAEKVQHAAEDAGEAVKEAAESAGEAVKEMVYGEPTIADQVKEVSHDTGEAIVETANDAVESETVKEMVTPEATFTEKIQNAAYSAEETVQGWWARVKEWWNPPWFTDDDGLTFIGVIFYLLLSASFVALCWFAYRWYRNRQTMNNAVQNLENVQMDGGVDVLEDDSSNEPSSDEDISDYDEDDELGWTELMWAAASGSEGRAAHLLTLSTTNIDARNVLEATALHIAAWCGNTNIVKLLLASGANQQATDIDGNNVLVHAALGFKDMMDEGEDYKTEEYRELIKYLVQVGLPVSDQVLKLVAEDPETLAFCQRARWSCRSYLSSGLASSSSESEEDSSSLSVANLDTELPTLLSPSMVLSESSPTPPPRTPGLELPTSLEGKL